MSNALHSAKKVKSNERTHKYLFGTYCLPRYSLAGLKITSYLSGFILLSVSSRRQIQIHYEMEFMFAFIYICVPISDIGYEAFQIPGTIRK